MSLSIPNVETNGATDPIDLAIIGAGAAGLAGCIFAGEAARDAERAGHAPLRIVAIDSANPIGAKILVSGGGRCNVTNERLRVDDYHGPRNAVRKVFKRFNEKDAVAWFQAMGVTLKHEPTGKLFPTTDRARTVLDALTRRAGELGVSLLTGRRVKRITRDEPNDCLVIDTQHADKRPSQLRARRVIMATGGRSLPKTGSDGSGWAIARQLGHTVTETYPALVPLVLGDTTADGCAMFHAALSGLSLRAELTTVVGGKPIDRRAGDLLFTHFGVSGPVVMDASRFWVIANAEGRIAKLTVSFLPGCSFEQVDGWLIEQGKAQPKRRVGKLIGEGVPMPAKGTKAKPRHGAARRDERGNAADRSGRQPSGADDEAVASHLPQRLIDALLNHVGIDPSTELGQLPRDRRRDLVHALTGFVLPVLRDRGWNPAEVTAGGVPLDEVDIRTCASKRCPGLFLVGEMLDCDGRIGGFNFQWAWSTGHIAGHAAIASLTTEG